MGINFTIIGMFAKASILVKMVMLGLIFSSILSWAIIFNRNRCIAIRLRIFNKFQSLLNSGVEVLNLYKQISSQKNKIGVESIFFKGVHEFLYLYKSGSCKPNIILKEVRRVMEIALHKENELLEKNLATLATIQSISPYIGLFGTILGIISVFHQLGSANSATLSVVAPGISEALIATAMGLLAAIPAGIFYNKFVYKIDNLITGYNTAMHELISFLSKRIYVSKQQQSSSVENSI